jgi:hypothetical protein
MSKKAEESIQDVGEQIKREAAKFESAKTEGKALREAQGQRRKKLHALVGLVRAEYENHKTVNGQKTWTEWCKWACPNKETKDPTRWFQKILQEPKKKDPNTVRVITLKPHEKVQIKMLVGNDGVSEGETVTFDLADIDTKRNGKWSATMRLTEAVTKRKAVSTVEEKKPKKLTADETREAIAKCKKGLGKDDGSSRWMKSLKEAMGRAWNRDTWMKVTTDKAFKDVNGYIYVRERTEADAVGWTKDKNDHWTNADGRTITKIGSNYTTWDKDGLTISGSQSLGIAMGFSREEYPIRPEASNEPNFEEIRMTKKEIQAAETALDDDANWEGFSTQDREAVDTIGFNLSLNTGRRDVIERFAYILKYYSAASLSTKMNKRWGQAADSLRIKIENFLAVQPMHPAAEAMNETLSGLEPILEQDKEEQCQTK